MEIEYSYIEDGHKTHDFYLEARINKVWPNHRTYIEKLSRGLGMDEWKVRFAEDSREVRKRGSGAMFKALKLIVIREHTIDEMRTTLLHEIIHVKNPDAKEDEVERRGTSWYSKLLQAQEES